MKEIAVLLTCHNRKEKTINCLRSLYKAIDLINNQIKFDVYLVDDGSTDSTSQEIAKCFSEINIIKGTGNLYWARGMILAWETAIRAYPNYDSFLLINDDVVFKDKFLFDLLDTHNYCLNQFNQSGIYVCSTMDPINSEMSYGGTLIIKKGIKVTSKKIIPTDIPTSCSMANANILMITKDVVNAIGVFDSQYHHQFADYDYTLTASRMGIPVLVCPEIGGYCENDHGKGWLSSDFTLNDRIKYLYSLNGLSYRDQIYYLKKNFKYQYPYYLIMLWLKTLFPFFWDKFKNESNLSRA